MSVTTFLIEAELELTLQGGIFAAFDTDTGKNVVIKKASKRLAKSGKSRDEIPISEDFLNEIKVLKYLTNQPRSHKYNFVKYIADWEEDKYYCYAMEKCYHNLFHIIHDIHTKGRMKQSTCKESKKIQRILNHETDYSKFIKSLFQQMIKTVWWLHKNNIAHMDISLENMMISNEKGTKIKIIDFGLAKDISKSAVFKGRIGKRRYMAPEVYNGCEYNACEADIWCLGICLFMMLVGSPLYNEPNIKDDLFHLLIRGGLEVITQTWNVSRLLSYDSYDLLIEIFKPECKRITMDGILESRFVDLRNWKTIETQKLTFEKIKNGFKKAGGICKRR